jgi:multiple sugar transport system substrate-binding protein
MYRNRGWRAAAAAVVLTMAATACSGGSGRDGEAAGRAPSPVEIRWFVGLGAGSDEATIPAQEAVVEEFNASQDDIVLKLEIVDNDQAYDVLNTQIAGGNAPDIVGPMGIRGRASFPGAWLDLQPLVDDAGYDLSDFDPALVDFYRVEDEGLVGLPFAVFPSFMFVNLDLFDEAGLPYPPQEYGAPYVDADGVEHDWDLDTMEELALQLTVDGNGNDANSPDFDPDSIVQFGFGNMWTDVRGQATLFGPGNFVDEDGNADRPGPLARRVPVDPGRPVELVLPPERGLRRVRHPRRWELVRVRQPRDGQHPPVVRDLLHRRPGRGVGHRRGARLPGRDHREAARGHLQHPALDLAPRGGLRGPHLPARPRG